MNYFYERNTKFLESDLNKTFEEILWMTNEEFRAWCIELRKEVVRIWDEEGIPPVVGKDKEDIIKGMKRLISSNVNELEIEDVNTNEKNVIRSTKTELSGICNPWFNSMMKTKINYSTKKEGKSIYDYFANDDLLETFITYATRHFKRDSFYHYSTPLSVGDVIEILHQPHKIVDVQTFLDSWNIASFHHGHYFWFCPVKENKEYTGYNQDLKLKQNLVIHIDDIPKFYFDDKARGIRRSPITNVDRERSEWYSIRYFKLGQKLFPIGLNAFHISFCQYAVNFPPLIARYLYERYTNHIKDQDVVNIYDPSAGWSGRLIGAMAVDVRRRIHYIGTDPNTDHNTTENRTKYHEIADFFNDNVRLKGRLIKRHHTYEIYQHGSENIHDDPSFQKYEGKLDVVFTSPPYFSKEQYSDDPEQSCLKFNNYEAWKTGFLRPTLETAVRYLRKDRYLLWNIADVAFDGELLSLEQDSSDILKELGMEYVETLKMALAPMPGGNRFEETGEEEIEMQRTIFGVKEVRTPIVTGKMKNFCTIQSGSKKMNLKFEPIFVWYKK